MSVATTGTEMAARMVTVGDFVLAVGGVPFEGKVIEIEDYDGDSVGFHTVRRGATTFTGVAGTTKVTVQRASGKASGITSERSYRRARALAGVR